MIEVARPVIAWIALALESLAVFVIAGSVAAGTIRFLIHIKNRVDDAYEQYKVRLGKAMLLGLEFLVAADIVRTVALEQTLHSVAILGLLVLIRTFLSWSLIVEMEGQWPWASKKAEKGEL